MSGRVTLSFAPGDIRRLQRVLRDVPADTRAALGPTLRAAGERAAASVAGAAPKGTGPLKRKKHSRSRRLAETAGTKYYADSPAVVVWVGSPTNYHARYVEGGTRLQRAQPFFAKNIRPVFESARDEIIRRVKGHRR